MSLVNTSCKHCGKGNIIHELFLRLRNVEYIIGKPLNITSGYRCSEHNQKVGGSPTSSHLIGMAADIEVVSDAHRYQLVQALIRVGITRIGVYKNFIHCDIDQAKNQNRLWVL